MTALLSCIELESAPNPTAAVIWMHGLGATSDDFAGLVPELDLEGCQPIRFVFPQAPSIPITINGGYVMPGWYDLYCAMALHTALRLPHKIAGVMALSGYLPLADRFATERNAANATTPIFMAHGTQDPVVILKRGEDSRDALASLGHKVQWHTYPMPHSVHPREVADIAAFLKQVLPA